MLQRIRYAVNPRSPWFWVGVAGATAVGVGVILWARRAAARPTIQPPGPGDVPLRPPPAPTTTPSGEPMPPPGPLATRVADWMADQDDDELLQARAAMPEHWWELLLLATQMPNDEQVVIVLNPVIVDLSLMDADARRQLQKDLVSAVGVLDALSVKKIFDDARDIAQA
jgi:hypothetical protein